MPPIFNLSNLKIGAQNVNTAYLGLHSLITPNVSSLINPAILFNENDQGAIYDFTDETTLFKDISRTIPVTKPGDILFSAMDLSGKNNHITRNSGTPSWHGQPAAWGDNLLNSPLMESSLDWVEGTGWSINNGLATKVAGTASSLSQTVSLIPDKVYMTQLRVVSRTAGNVFIRLNGTTVVTHFSGYNGAGEYLEVLMSVSGNDTLEIYADAAFAGTINTVGLYEVISFYDMGVKADFSERLLTGNIDMSATDEMTIVVSTKRSNRNGNMFIGQVASAATADGEIISHTSAVGFVGQGGPGGTADTVTINDPDFQASGSRYNIFAISRKGNAQGIENQHILRMSGVDFAQSNTGGPLSTSNNSPNTKISLLSWLNSSSRFCGTMYRVFVINRILSDSELDDVVNWVSCNSNAKVAAVTGDSTWEKDSASAGLGRGLTSNTHSFIGPFSSLISIANWGDDTLEQNQDWSALTTSRLNEVTDVQISVGLNDIAGRVDNGATTSQILNELQSYINEIKLDCPSAKIIGWQIPPCKGWLDGRTNVENCIAARNAWNTALLDGTITGLDAVATDHIAKMDDGNGYLRPILNTGAYGDRDGVHPGELGRLIMGVSARKARVALGLMESERTFS